MKKTLLMISLPAVFGLLLVILVVLNLHQLEAGMIDVRHALVLEIPVCLAGFLSSFICFLSACYWIVKRRWKMAVTSLISIGIFWLCFIIAGSQGGAFLYAT